jgi:centractin
MASEAQPIVIDLGSGVVKAGFAGSDEPQTVFHNYVGRPKHKRVMAGAAEGDAFVGRRAEELRGLLKVRHPLEHGRVADWDALERVLRHAYGELRAASEEHPLLLTEPPLNPRRDREQLAKRLFETFKVPALYLCAPSVLALYASGRTTGLVLDCGDGVTHCMPVVEGFAVQHAVARMDVAGRDVTENLATLLRRSGSGHSLCTSAEKEVAREIKEACCYVAVDPTKEEERAALTQHERTAPGSPWGSYRLPDGTAIELGPERFRAPEILFKPDTIGDENPGVHELVVNTIARVDIELRTTLYSSILLSGGSTKLQDFGQRLLNEVRGIAPKDMKIRIVAPPERGVSAWIGGSLLASLATFRKMWVSKEEYEQSGAGIIQRKFF